MKRPTSVTAICLLSLTACGGGAETAAPAATVTVTQTVAPPPSATTAPTTTPPAKTEPTKAAAAKKYVMPDVVGMSLQDAQDKVQTAVGSFFFSTSHDVSGQGRVQVLDAGWQVCDQNLKPGAKFTEDTEVDLGVVRVSENCP